METINKKRKKRKTRKCLDELRRKTHQTVDVYKINKNIDAAHKNKSNCNKNNYITSNRLTLLNKAVSSETVTRIQLGELEKKKLKLNKNSETITSNIHANIVPPLEYNKNKTIIGKHNKHTTEDNSDIEMFSPNINNGKESDKKGTPKSVILFSPESQNGEIIDTKLDSPIAISLLSSSSPSTINTTCETNIYDDIMDSIELYIEHKHPQILKTVDANIRKSKAELMKLCFESKSKSIVSNKENSSPNISIIQNPRNYIGYSWYQCSKSNTSGVHVTSPAESNSSVSTHIPTPSPTVSAVFDTPEYSYYPHRLN